MKHSVFALGERRLEGEYKNIRAAGDLEIVNSKARSLLCAGDIDIRDTAIGKIRTAGDINAVNLNFKHCKAAGDITLGGICRGDTIVGIGNMYADYLECRCIRTGTDPKHIRGSDSKKWSWRGIYKAETFEVQLPLLLEMEYEFQNILAYGEITSQKEIACTAFYAFGGVSAPAVNAERVFVLVKGSVDIGEIVGTKITVDNIFKPDRAFAAIPKTWKYRKTEESGHCMVNAETISGDSIYIKHTKARAVSGNDVEIGELCVIEEVTYRNTIKISDKAAVGKVVKQ